MGLGLLFGAGEAIQFHFYNMCIPPDISVLGFFLSPLGGLAVPDFLGTPLGVSYMGI